jgi:hypothetical protein
MAKSRISNQERSKQMTASSRQETAHMVAEISGKGMMKTIGTGENVEKMIAATASETIGEGDEIGAARQITKEAARATERIEIVGERKISRLQDLFKGLTCARGVPVVGTSDAKTDNSPDSKAKREAATADALAKAKAMVEAEQKKSIKSETEAETKQSVDKDDVATAQETKLAEPDTKTSAPAIKGEESGEAYSKKRAREGEQEEESDSAPPKAKKVDIKDEPVVANGHS